MIITIERDTPTIQRERFEVVASVSDAAALQLMSPRELATWLEEHEVGDRFVEQVASWYEGIDDSTVRIEQIVDRCR